MFVISGVLNSWDGVNCDRGCGRSRLVGLMVSMVLSGFVVRLFYV